MADSTRNSSYPPRPGLTHVANWMLLGAWVLMMPPVPLGTALPPMEKWKVLSQHKTTADCEKNREAMRQAARVTAAKNPNASALDVATALGQLQAKCVEIKSPEPAEASKPARPEQPATPPPAEPARPAAKH